MPKLVKTPLPTQAKFSKLSKQKKIDTIIQWYKDNPSYLGYSSSNLKDVYPYKEFEYVHVARQSMGGAAVQSKYSIDNRLKDNELRDMLEANREEIIRLLNASITDNVQKRPGSELADKYRVPTEALRQIKLKPERRDNPTFFDTEGMWVVLTDVHAPWEFLLALKAIKKFIKAYKSKIVGFVIAGDFLDCNSLSMHDMGKKPIPGVTLAWEYQEGERLLSELIEPLSKSCYKIYIYGNHEDRYFRRMAESNTAKFGDALMSPTDGLKLVEKGFYVYENWSQDYVDIGGISVHHGLSVSIHAAYQNLQRFNCSNASGHNHKLQLVTSHGRVSACFGFLGDRRAEVFNYAPMASKHSWQEAFGLINVDKTGIGHVSPVIIQPDGSFYVGADRFTP